MKNVISILVFIYLLLTTTLISQSKIGSYKDLAKILENMEYSTNGFDDLRKTWLINDQLLIRAIYNHLYNNNNLVFASPNNFNNDFNKVRNKLHENEINILVKKRYFDNELDSLFFYERREIELLDNLKFYSTNELNPIFKPLSDYTYISEILNADIYEGKSFYNHVKEMEYSRLDYSNNLYYAPNWASFDANFNFLEPELMFLSTPSSQDPEVYQFSFFGKWGNDYLSLPGWYSSDYIGGGKLTFKNDALQPNNFSYSLSIGAALPAATPFTKELPSKELRISGYNIYYKFEGAPLNIFDPFGILKFNSKDYKFIFEGKFTLSDFKRADYGDTERTDFYSIRTYFIAELKRYKLFEDIEFFKGFELGDIGLGVGIVSHDIYHYRSVPGQSEVLDLPPWKTAWDKYEHFVFLEMDISNYESVIQHNISPILNYNFDGQYGYWGFRASLMLSDFIGFDIRYFQEYDFREAKFPPWRTDRYFVFSPVIRINY